MGMIQILAYLLVSATATPSPPAPDTATVESIEAAAVDSTRYVVRLPRIFRNPGNSRDTAAVTITTLDGDLAGFDLKIACDAAGVRIVDIMPGDLGDSCGWEYFASRDLGALTDEPIQSLWKIVGLAKSSADTSKPACNEVSGEVTIARLIVEYDPSIHPLDTIAALFFYWEDCTDNTLAPADGVRMAISNQVHDYLQRPQARSAAVFPTRTGAPSQCVKLSAQNHPRRLIDFHNGGINLLGPPIDSTQSDTLQPAE